ncbi:hypothetical protein ACFXHA_43460 [Nocardia sp. NPDC059240]|uniref:hypothetical protein n=1 Tax=Nocardia sp. NPDC059240 TaxID=3346786 RepID=UPI00368DE129
MTDHNTDIGFRHNNFVTDIDDLIAGSSLGGEAARDIQNRISDARASRISSALAARYRCEQAQAAMELDETKDCDRGPDETELAAIVELLKARNEPWRVACSSEQLSMLLGPAQRTEQP